MIIMKRSLKWPQALNKYLVDVQKQTYKLGEHDCCTFTAGAVKAMTGVDPMKEFRGQYDDEDSFERALKEIGAGSLYRTLAAKFGKSVTGAKGRRGDIAFYEGCCGIIMGRTAIFLYKDGFGMVSITQVQRSFRVGWD